jgi:hypothetical protein
MTPLMKVLRETPSAEESVITVSREELASP